MAHLSVKWLVVWTFLLCAGADGANILGLFSSHSPSHLIVHMSVVKVLAEAGHNITVVSTIKPAVTHKSIHHIVVPFSEEQERIFEAQLTEIAQKKSSIFGTLSRLLSSTNNMISSQYELLSDERFKRIYETKFDLMIMGYFLNDFQLAVAAKLKCPVILNWMSAPMGIIDYYVGNPIEVSYVPNIATSVARGEVMTFGQRLQNFVTSQFIEITMFLFYGRVTNLYEAIAAEEPHLPTLEQMKKKVSLVFTNSHSISEGPIRPLVPASVEIGGIQIKDKADPLPADIEQFLAEAKYGAILLSLGSNIKGKSVRPEVVQTMFKVLSVLKQRVIWKWEDLEHTPGVSSNILYKKWLPQDDILANPKIKLFITHAGKGGVTEAQYHGVPMVALPIFGDQDSNAELIQSSGYGVYLDILKLTEANFKAALLEVLGNKTYTQNIKRFSALYTDRPLSAKQTVLYWTEYVLRHKGAYHIQSPAIHMCTISYHNLDIYAVLILTIFLSLWLSWKVIKVVGCKICRKQKKTKQH